VTHPSLPFCLGARDIALGLASPLAGREDAVEAAADCVLKGAVAERAADQFVAAQRGEAGIVGVRIEEIGEFRRPVEERPRLDEPAVAVARFRQPSGLASPRARDPNRAMRSFAKPSRCARPPLIRRCFATTPSPARGEGARPPVEIV